MSETQIPAYVDTRKVFHQHEELIGTVSLQSLPRFKESLANDQGIVEIALYFSVNDSKQRIIKGNISAHVEVACQRCLEPLAIYLEDDICLVLLEEESAAASLGPEFDPWICSEFKLLLTEVVDEQLMLCMPIVNYHETEDCLKQLEYKRVELSTNSSSQASFKESPFSVLKNLKNKT
ncbi:YceD family protein [Gammaproteobacteria bacterium]|nr:YceD family protein [Gammaproteobacteria bacterium]